MNQILQINIFSHYKRRLEFCFLQLNELEKINDQNKPKIKIVVFTIPELKNEWEYKIKNINSNGITAEISKCDSPDYNVKTNEAINSPCLYSSRLDDDMFINHHIWNFMIDHLHYLENPQIWTICPLYTSCIPTTEFFIENFMNADDKKYIYSLFKRDNIPIKPWHIFCDYTHLKNKIDMMTVWDSILFFEELSKHNTPYRGIHPIRFSSDANIFICEKAIENICDFLTKNDYQLFTFNSHATHYGVFKTSTWRDAVLNYTIDTFDETAINNYKIVKNMTSCYIKNGFAIHMAYGYTSIMETIEQKYITALKKLIC